MKFPVLYYLATLTVVLATSDEANSTQITSVTQLLEVELLPRQTEIPASTIEYEVSATY